MSKNLIPALCKFHKENKKPVSSLAAIVLNPERKLMPGLEKLAFFSLHHSHCR